MNASASEAAPSGTSSIWMGKERTGKPSSLSTSGAYFPNRSDSKFPSSSTLTRMAGPLSFDGVTLRVYHARRRGKRRYTSPNASPTARMQNATAHATTHWDTTSFAAVRPFVSFFTVAMAATQGV